MLWSLLPPQSPNWMIWESKAGLFCTSISCLFCSNINVKVEYLINDCLGQEVWLCYFSLLLFENMVYLIGNVANLDHVFSYLKHNKSCACMYKTLLITTIVHKQIYPYIHTSIHIQILNKNSIQISFMAMKHNYLHVR